MGGDDLDGITGEIVAAAIEVHRTLGPGLLESVYQSCLSRELSIRGIPHEVQIAVPIVYKGEPVSPDALKLDILVRRCVVVELKCVEKVLKVHEAQLLSYLRLTDKRIGLLINFNVPLLKEGVHRIVNNY